MKNYFIPHKLKPGDVTNLSDEDSELIIGNKLHTLEDPIEVSNLEGVFLAIITNIETASVEVEIVKKLRDVKEIDNNYHITLIQSTMHDQKFDFLLEKAVEVGIHKIIPIESKYSTQSRNKAIKRHGMWNKKIKEAQEQSRNPNILDLEKPIKIKDLKNIKSKNKICLSTEVITEKSFKDILHKKEPHTTYTIAVGPEKGWSSSDLKVFEKLDFEFSKMGNNILRTETAGIVAASILNFRAGLY